MKYKICVTQNSLLNRPELQISLLKKIITSTSLERWGLTQQLAPAEFTEVYVPQCLFPVSGSNYYSLAIYLLQPQYKYHKQTHLLTTVWFPLLL